MTQIPLHVGIYGFPFPDRLQITALPLIRALLDAGLEIWVIQPPATLTSLAHPRFHLVRARSVYRALKTALGQINVLHVGQAKLLQDITGWQGKTVLELSGFPFNAAQLPVATVHVTPVANRLWSKAVVTRPVLNLVGLPQATLQAAPLHVVSIMPLIWESGLEFAIDAVAQAIQAGANLRYTIVGSGDYEDALVYGARLWGLWQTGQIQFRPADQAAAALAEAQMLLHVPYVGHFSVVVLEAMARGLPAIVSDAPPLPQMVGETAYMVPRRQPDRLRDTLIDAARQPDDRRRMAALGQVQALKWDNRDPADWISVYQNLRESAG